MKHITEAQRLEAKKANSEQHRFVESCMNKWSGVKTGGFKLGEHLVKLSETSLARAQVAAVAVENQERHFKLLTEAQLSTAFGTSLRPEHLLKATYLGTAQSKLADMFTVVPLSSTDDVFMYVYANNASSLRGATANQRTFETQSSFYAGETYPPTAMTGAINSSNKTFTTTLSPLPLIPLWIKVFVGDALVGIDNGSGTIINFNGGTGIDETATNTVDYNSTGAVTVNFATAPVTGTTVTIQWNSSLESKANFDSYAGQLTLELRKERFNARPFPLGFDYSMMTQVMLDSDNIGNAHELLTKAVSEALAKSKDERGIRFVSQIARTNTAFTFNTNFAAAGAVDRKLWAQNLSNAIDNVSATITNETQRGEVNKVIGAPLAIAYLRNLDRFTPDDSEVGYAGARKVGTLDGKEVFQIPVTSGTNAGLANNELLLTFSNPMTPQDCPAIFGDLTTLSAELTFPQLNTQGTLASVYDQRMINSKFARILSLTGLTTSI